MPTGFFQFPLQWDDTSSGVATDVSFLNDKPAGKNGHIVARDGHFIEENTGKRIRFFGTNIGAGEAFPEKADAELIAKRLAKAGVNIVRLHHLDNPWAIQSGGSIWDPNRPDRQQLDPAQLDKLDYLIYQLKEQGIYVNINLKVSKELTPADGMPEIASRMSKFTHQKRMDFFQKRMIELQKDYARKLLTHRNPYTRHDLHRGPGRGGASRSTTRTRWWASGRHPRQGPRHAARGVPLGTARPVERVAAKRKYGTDEKLPRGLDAGCGTPPGPIHPDTPDAPVDDRELTRPGGR